MNDGNKHDAHEPRKFKGQQISDDEEERAAPEQTETQRRNSDKLTLRRSSVNDDKERAGTAPKLIGSRDCQYSNKFQKANTNSLRKAANTRKRRRNKRKIWPGKIVDVANIPETKNFSAHHPREINNKSNDINFNGVDQSRLNANRKRNYQAPEPAEIEGVISDEKDT